MKGPPSKRQSPYCVYKYLYKVRQGTGSYYLHLELGPRAHAHLLGSGSKSASLSCSITAISTIVAGASNGCVLQQGTPREMKTATKQEHHLGSQEQHHTRPSNISHTSLKLLKLRRPVSTTCRMSCQNVLERAPGRGKPSAAVKPLSVGALGLHPLLCTVPHQTSWWLSHLLPEPRGAGAWGALSWGAPAPLPASQGQFNGVAQLYSFHTAGTSGWDSGSQSEVRVQQNHLQHLKKNPKPRPGRPK